MLIPYTPVPIMLDSETSLKKKVDDFIKKSPSPYMIKNPIYHGEAPHEVRKFDEKHNFPLEGRDEPKPNKLKMIHPGSLKSEQHSVTKTNLKDLVSGRKDRHYPIHVAKSHNGDHWVLDGNHRTALAHIENKPIEAHVYDMKEHKED